MAKVSEDFLDHEVRQEHERFEALIRAERELDERHPPVWEYARDGTRCTHKRIVESSGRVSRCSEDAAWLKLHVAPGKKVLPIGLFCEDHAREHGKKDRR